MNGTLASAANRLGVSIVLASVILVVGLRGPHPAENGPEPDQTSKRDAAVAQASAEITPAEKSGVQACMDPPGSQRVPIVDSEPGETNDQASCLDPPSEDEVWNQLAESRLGPTSSGFIQRARAKISIEKIGEKVDPCKVYPLAGACRLVHCHYKCSVSFDESYSTADPIPTNHRKARVEVVFIDKDHLRRCSSPVAPSTLP